MDDKSQDKNIEETTQSASDQPASIPSSSTDYTPADVVTTSASESITPENESVSVPAEGKTSIEPSAEVDVSLEHPVETVSASEDASQLTPAAIPSDVVAIAETSTADKSQEAQAGGVSKAPIIFGVVLVAGLLLSGTLIYKNVTDKSRHQDSSQAMEQPSSMPSMSAKDTSVDTGDSQLEKDSQELDKKMSNLGAEMSEVDKGLNDQE